MILTGDCMEVMPTLEAESVDAVVTDPPYGLEFMGKEWDKLGATVEHPDDGEGPWGRTKRVRFGASARTAQTWHERWATEAFRLAKPSAYLLAFGGTRTVHRMTCAIEDAGWIVRDMLVWAYASGFPKSKSSLKPAWEPIVMARKPGPLRELAIDACRIPGTDNVTFERTAGDRSRDQYRTGTVVGGQTPIDLGRWPANVILTDPIFDGGWDGVVGGGEVKAATSFSRHGTGIFDFGDQDLQPGYGDSGTYSRFFLIPKADRAEREPIWSDLPERVISVWGGDEDDLTPGKKSTVARRNVHPTVKPLELVRHLVRLVTPTGGLVMDPFLGSGTTGIAAEMEGFRWLGIEREPEYVRIAEARLHGTQRGLGLPESATNPGPVLTAYAQELRRLVPEEPDGRG